MRVLADTCEFWNCGQGPFSPQGPVADRMHSVFLPMFVISVIVFVGVGGAIIYAALRFRRKYDDEEPAQVHGNNKLEVAWTVLPFAVLIGLFVYTAVNMPFINNVPDAEKATAMNVCVQGQQFNWVFVYYDDARYGSGDACSAHKRQDPATGHTVFTPESGQPVVVTSKLMVPVHTDVKLTIVSADVNHSFYAPTVGGQVNAVPGLVNDMWFNLDSAGKYHGACTELCGTNHATMLIEIDALSQTDYNVWYQQQKAAKQGGGTATASPTAAPSVVGTSPSQAPSPSPSPGG